MTARRLGRAVARARRDGDVELFELAVATGLSPAALSDIEAGERLPSAATLSRIALGLTVLAGADPDELTADWARLHPGGGDDVTVGTADPAAAIARRDTRRRRGFGKPL